MDARRRAAAMALLGGMLAMTPAQAGGESQARRERTTLAVEITGFRSDRGSARVALWRSRDGFPADASKAVRRLDVPIKAGCARLTVEGLEPGPWAVAAFHDENGSGRLERGFLGIPKEGLGVSRDAKGAFGPPSFEAARLMLGVGEQRVSFRLFYY